MITEYKGKDKESKGYLEMRNVITAEELNAPGVSIPQYAWILKNKSHLIWQALSAAISSQWKPNRNKF